jgi:hypothetical protein
MRILLIGAAALLASASLAWGQVAPSLEQDPRFIANKAKLQAEAGPSAVAEAQRVFGGFATKLYWATALVEGRRGYCTGILIAKDAVLTAAHCACDGISRSVSFGRSPDGSIGALVKGAPVILGSCSDLSNPPDLALLFLRTPMAAPVVPWKFATSAQIDQASTARVVGYGRTSLADVSPRRFKMRADVPIASAACQGIVGGAADSDEYGCRAGAELVAGKIGSNIDTCKGDSGGPIFIPGPNHLTDPEDYYLAATTSRAIKKGRVCGDGGVYVRLDTPEVQRWLVQNGITPTFAGP